MTKLLKNQRKTSHYFFSRGEAKSEIGKYASALEDFKSISDNAYDTQKHISMGICYYNLGFYDDAEKEYREAINNKSELVEAYYNLAVLYNSENKRDKARKLLDTCLNINRDFSHARIAIKKLNISEQADWYDWWFGLERGMKKKFLGILLLAGIFSIAATTAYSSLSNPETNVVGPVISAAFLAGILLLPSLKKVKLGEVELDTESPLPKNIELQSAKAHLNFEYVRKLFPNISI